MRQFYIFKTARILTAEDIIKLRQFILTAFFVTISFFLQTIVLDARGVPESFADLVEDVGSSVVNITTTTKVEAPVVPRGVVPEGSPFEELFRDFQNPNSPRQRPRNANALGSGFVISSDGFIVTNHHVINGADQITIEFNDGSFRDAVVIGSDENIDIALLKVDAETPLEFVEFGDSDISRVGDWVMAMGNPLGQGFSVSVGIISARNRELSGNYDDYIQTDAAINRGNSGGPLFNMDGEVVGVNTAILSPNGGSIGIGFSMASNVVEPVVKQLKEFGEVRRGWLGVSIGDLNQDMADALGMKEPSGSIVLEVYDGPSKDAGLLASDVIVMFDNKEVSNSGELVRIVGDTTVGRTVDVFVLRQGKRIKVRVKLGQRPTNKELNKQVAPLEPTKPNEDAIDGAGLSELTDSLREEYGIDPSISGVIIMSVDETSSAYENGLRKGDVITDVAQKPIGSVEEVEELVSSAKSEGRQSVLLLVRREGQPRFIVLKFN
jgi:serine protease Do